MNATYERHLEFSLKSATWISYHSHLHMHCEIIHIIDGSVAATIDGVRYTAGKNQAFFILPHQIHSFESVGYNKSNIMFVSPLMLPQYSELMRNSILENPVISPKNPGTVQLCANIIEHLFESFPGKQDVFSTRTVDGDALTESALGRSLTESYVSLLLDGASWKKKNVSAMNNARRVLEFCLEHYREDISVYKVADAVGITEHTVTRVFTNVLHCNFRKYINYLRMSEITRKLAETSNPITDIAKEYGFDTLRTFNRVFADEYGCTPSEYRKKYRNNEVDSDK